MDELKAAGITDSELRNSYLECKRLNNLHGKTYFLATRLLPPAKRPFVHALYGFARYADEIVDDLASTLTEDEKADALKSWGTEVLANIKSGKSHDHIGAALVDTVNRFSIPISYFEAFLHSMTMDLTVTDYHTYEDLYEYVYGSAAVIGLQMVPILGTVSKQAIAEAKQAGISVKMITGDHASTASSIGRELGLIEGNSVAMTGTEIDTVSDEELDARIESVSVFARVAPEHKIRLVTALQRKGHIVAMTGDGVNDAPALKKSDIGVAMGITGTEVTKEAATMVLTDDNFATIVGAVKQGRAIYDNIVKFVRFQLSTTLGFAILFLATSITGIAGGKPFAAIAVLWVNMIMDGPPAMALGLDRPDSDVMQRSPRPKEERILTRNRWVAVLFASLVMAVGTLLVLVIAPGEEAAAGVATVAGTMAFNTFVLFQFFNILNVRNDRRSVFRRDTLGNRYLWTALGAVITLQIGVTHWGPMQRLFDTTSISLVQWGLCVAVASSIIFLDVSLATAAPRVGFNRDRPLLLGNPRAQWQALSDQRRPIYEKLATLSIKVDDMSVDEIISIIESIMP